MISSTFSCTDRFICQPIEDCKSNEESTWWAHCKREVVPRIIALATSIFAAIDLVVHFTVGCAKKWRWIAAGPGVANEIIASHFQKANLAFTKGLLSSFIAPFSLDWIDFLRLPRELDVSEISHPITDNWVMQRLHPGLEKINLKGSEITDATIHEINRRCRRLQHLNLEQCLQITGEALTALVVNCIIINPNIKLNLAFCKNLDTRTISAIGVGIFRKLSNQLREFPSLGTDNSYSESSIELFINDLRETIGLNPQTEATIRNLGPQLIENFGLKKAIKNLLQYFYAPYGIGYYSMMLAENFCGPELTINHVYYLPLFLKELQDIEEFQDQIPIFKLMEEQVLLKRGFLQGRSTQTEQDALNLAAMYRTKLEGLSPGEKFAIPASWNGTHGIIYLFEKQENGHIDFSIVNTGRGLLFHALGFKKMKIKGNKKQYCPICTWKNLSLSLNPSRDLGSSTSDGIADDMLDILMKCDLNLLDTDDAQIYFNHPHLTNSASTTFDLLATIQDSMPNSFNFNIITDDEERLLREHEIITDNSEDLFITPQRSGSCKLSRYKALLRVLVNDTETYKKGTFKLKAKTLVNFYSDFCKIWKSDPEAANFLNLAVQEYKRRTVKLRDHWGIEAETLLGEDLYNKLEEIITEVERESQISTEIDF